MPLTLTSTLPDSALLHLNLTGSSNPKDAEELIVQLQKKLARSKRVKAVVLDLSQVNTEKFSLRVFDVAKQLLATRMRLAVEIVTPISLYEELRDSDDLPKAEPGACVSYGGMVLRLVTSSVAKSPETAFFSCKGKVRQVMGNRVIISLFVDEDNEAMGELDRRQFQSQAPEPGLLFTYSAQVVEPGETRVRIIETPATSVPMDAKLDNWSKLVGVLKGTKF